MKVFINLAVRDLAASIDFFSKLGFRFDSRFCDDMTACLVINENAYVMLLIETLFQRFTAQDVARGEMILAVSAHSRDSVDALVKLAIGAGGKASNDPYDNGTMYGWGFEDLDGHVWEVIHLRGTEVAYAAPSV